VTPSERPGLGQGLAHLIPPSPPAVSPAQGGDLPEWLERLVVSVARRAAEEVLHKDVAVEALDDEHVDDGAKAPETALRHFYADYLGRLDEVDPVDEDETERRDLVVALALAAAAPRLLADTVDRLRTHNGWSWSDIGTVAGVSRQAAAQRWGRPAS
jgi:hypothetical protein